jgi:hypothetical protein
MLVVKTMDVGGDLLDPPATPTASFDGGAATNLAPIKDKLKSYQFVKVPDGTQKITVSIPAGGDFWDFSQDLTLNAGTTPTISLLSPVNPGAFVMPVSNPNTTDSVVELWIVLTQIRDGTADVTAAAQNSDLGTDPWFAHLAKFSKEKWLRDSWAAFRWTPQPVSLYARDQWFTAAPTILGPDGATGVNLLNWVEVKRTPASGTLLYLRRPTLPMLVGVWLPAGQEFPPQTDISYNLYLHPNTTTVSYPPDDPNFQYKYPIRWHYLDLCGKYLTYWCGFTNHHMVAKKKVALVMPIGKAGEQWGTKFVTFDGFHRLLQEINFWLQRKDGKLGWSSIRWTLGPCAVSGFSAGAKFIRDAFLSSRQTKRASDFYDKVMKEIYLFDGVIDQTGASGAFRPKLKDWFRKGDENRRIATYSQSPEWDELAGWFDLPSVRTLSAPKVQGIVPQAKEGHSTKGSYVFVHTLFMGAAFTNAPNPPSYDWAHGTFPQYFAAHAIAMSPNFPVVS